ncbi:hypothetical protein ASG60_08035 [Methylobacterium sp. Leaf469]|nr:hypothetical protein ASG60_08035 [Methylobacterium sp. Leaf469]
MNPRSRRAARELSGYLIRLYGAQPGLRISEADPLDGSPRVQVYAEGIEATRPPPDDGRTYGADSVDRWAPAFVSSVARLAARLVAIRSERYSPSGGLVPADMHEGVEDLEAAFGRLFEGAVEVDVPWQALARAVAETLQVEDLLDGVESSQIKSKFAELRWYFKSIPKPIRGQINVFVEAATVLSTVVCERCGAPGGHRPGPWHQIRCDACQDDWERSRRAG